jgi:glycosyltransferase involved in cell wall biosynthesis
VSGKPLLVGGEPTCVVVPAFDAEASLEAVLADILSTLGCAPGSVVVVDDGSTDRTLDVARAAGVPVVRSVLNEGKGAAIVRGLRRALAAGFTVAVTVDADGQHPASSAQALLLASDDPRALVLGVRDLKKDGAPRKNQFSNGVSNFFLSRFSGRALSDTQCGLRRYPIRETLALHARARGYAFESEIILRSIAARIPVLEHPVRVVYPPEAQRVTHFHSVKDPARIVATVVRTLHDLRKAR